ncbi:MAG TPA: ferritin-like domain-containing protein [Solirubrobacterales bacterium]|nr:ferritin-like domain-containing protein [Solirubrobacterales bacterium]
MPSEEKLDVAEAIKRLNLALAQQYRSALQYSIVASSLQGLEAQSLGAKLTEFGDDELSGARQLIEKIVSFGGEPTTEVADLRFEAEAADAVAWLARCEEEVVEALQEAIEPTGREGRSEALEHMLEHQIMRKQEQVDFLKRALGGPSGD